MRYGLTSAGRLAGLVVSCLGLCSLANAAEDSTAPPSGRVPVIDVTDLYHPPQDPGDNLDLIAAYALPEVDLKAVILDITDTFRQPVARMDEPWPVNDTDGPREPGIIPVQQLNYIFDRNVPSGIGPFTRMRDPRDKMLDAPVYQQSGIELMLRVLRESPEPVEIVSFGSARPVAVAYNREPELFRQKLRLLHLSAGSTGKYVEWNVMLDPQAIVCLLRSDLPIAIYPCATGDGPFAYGRHNSFWKLENLGFIERMDPRLRRYVVYAMSRNRSSDFLRAVEVDPPAEAVQSVAKRSHSVWETAIWINVARRVIAGRHFGMKYELVPADRITADISGTLPNELRPCKINVRDDGLFTFELTSEPTNFRIYDRGDPAKNEAALRQALPHLYETFPCSGHTSSKPAS